MEAISSQQHVSNSYNQRGAQSNKEDLTSAAIIELYIGLKQKLKEQGTNKDEEEDNCEEQQDLASLEDEKKRLYQLGNLVVIDYIRSSMDILLNLKIEQALLSQQNNTKGKTNQMYINSSRGGHGASHNESIQDSQRSSSQSIMTHREDPPKVYEEMIQSLEADVRKHIRIEQQLKLHIESIEYRVDELENENEKLLQQASQYENMKADIEKTYKKKTEQLEFDLSTLKQEIRNQDSRYNNDIKLLKEKQETEKEQYKLEIQRLQDELQNLKSFSPMPFETTCSSCQRTTKSLNKTRQSKESQDQNSNSRSASKNTKDLSLETLDKKTTAIQQILFKKTNTQFCNCTCANCLVAHQCENYSIVQQPSSATNHYKNLQKQFLERPIQGSSKQQEQSDLVKVQKDLNKFMVAEKRQSSKKRANMNSNVSTYNTNLNLSSLTTSTPEKQSTNIKNLLNALNMSTQSASNNGRSKKNNFIPSNTQISFCCQNTSSLNNKFNAISNAYWASINEDNPYMGNQQLHPNLLQKNGNDSSTNTVNKNVLFYDQSSNASLNQNDNSMVVLQNKAAANRSTFNIPSPNTNMNSCFDKDISFQSATRAGLSNDVTGLLGLQDIINKDNEDESSDSILNSHRRSRSQNVGSSIKKHSKSERKGGSRMTMMKKRLNNIGSGANQNDIFRSGTYQSAKNGSHQRDITPLKNLSNQNQLFGCNNQNVLNSDERQKLFNTFMREMTQSLREHNHNSNVKKKKFNVISNEGMPQQMRIISNPSSRPRSQLAMTNCSNQQQSINNNYSTAMSQNPQATLKYKFISGSSGSGTMLNPSRNNPIHKIKDFFVNNTYNTSLGNTSASIASQILGMTSQSQSQNRSSVKKQGTNDNYQFSPSRKSKN